MRRGTQNIANQLPNEMNNLMRNPIQFLAQRNLNLPQGFNGGPREIVQYLLDSGQMKQEDFGKLQSYVSRIMPMN